MNFLRSPLQARIVQWLVAPGDSVRRGDVVVVLEAMKMEHELRAESDARVLELLFEPEESVQMNDVLLRAEPVATSPAVAAKASVHPHPPGQVRPDLQAMLNRDALTQDAARPDAVARRHVLGLRTARENLADLCDEGSFIEYGALAVAAQRARRSQGDLVANTPADGMVTGIGSVNAADCGPERSRTVVMAY
ncbi:biotin/lipoyl-containing protein, partial [Hydrogenophaga sp.]|uniref:acetyl-CoA carboxylase biotin carboxyl carrier protein subunit n=1 Tax=Hydrogenophaga sp. TaxID=1904254 RepID=UPI0025C0909C